MGRKGAVGSFEYVMAFIEYITCGHERVVILTAAQSRLDHDQGMIGDTISARRERRTLRSMKHFLKCVQEEKMHSPRLSASP